MKSFFICFTLILSISVFAQQGNKPVTKRIIVKTNVLNLVSGRPTLSIEKHFSKSFSTELSFVHGRFNNILYTDHYSYNGFLLRAKKYFMEVEYGNLNPYMGLYIGNLNRTIETEAGRIDNNGWLSYPARSFSSNSIRGGGSFGLAYISKSRIILDGQMSLGYGRYTQLSKPNPDRYSNGYLDAQVWLSVGYCF